VNQDLKESQSASLAKTASITQTQDGHQTTSVSQHSDTGANNAKVLQSLQLKASATGGTSITQNQDTNGNGPDTSAAIYQNSDQDSGPITSTGTNNAYVLQSNDLNASGAKTGALTQNQGNFDTGIFNYTDQRSTGVSTTQVNQNEHQSLGESQYGSLSQTQIGPLWADPNQASNPGDTFTVSQSSDQNGGPGADQVDKEEAACGSSGVCHLTEKASNDHQNADVTVRHRGDTRYVVRHRLRVADMLQQRVHEPARGVTAAGTKHLLAVPVGTGLRPGDHLSRVQRQQRVLRRVHTDRNGNGNWLRDLGSGRFRRQRDGLWHVHEQRFRLRHRAEHHRCPHGWQPSMDGR
jgi:hypothetical protein